MNNCSYEDWTLAQVAKALEDREKEERVIKVPLFQRSIVWKKEQEE